MSPRGPDCPASDSCSPAERYQELFADVQRARLFEDSKTFPDCAPRRDPRRILTDYRRERSQPGFSLADFVHANFTPQHPIAEAYVSPPGQSLADHIDSLWDILTRRPSEHPDCGSLLPLPCPYVVPGGRFAELYYWDSYFTMLGLAGDGGREALLGPMLDNFAHLIDTFGHVPNGTRTYYLSRSQPPLFCLMVELCEQKGVRRAADYLPQLRREHEFWMRGEARLADGEARERVVRLDGGAVLNRYWDAHDTPREESWREDVATAEAALQRPAREVFRDLRAACESGWDFGSRWLDGGSLSSIRTTAILPVDLNCFLQRLESLIARLSREAGDDGAARDFAGRAERRRRAIVQTFWSDEARAWLDYDWQRREARRGLTAATVVPLFTGIANREHAAATAATCRAHLLAPGGFATSTKPSGEQWDRPNGWAPLQWMAVCGFERYGETSLACAIRSRWLRTVGEVYRREAKLVEKYALRELPHQRSEGGAGGEYPLQDGFGWTNGVTRHWLHSEPRHNVAVGGAEAPPDPQDQEHHEPPGGAQRH